MTRQEIPTEVIKRIWYQQCDTGPVCSVLLLLKQSIHSFAAQGLGAKGRLASCASCNCMVARHTFEHATPSALEQHAQLICHPRSLKHLGTVCQKMSRAPINSYLDSHPFCAPFMAHSASET